MINMIIIIIDGEFPDIIISGNLIFSGKDFINEDVVVNNNIFSICYKD